MKPNKHYMWQSVKGTTRIDIDETPPKPNLTHKIKIIQQGLINYIKNIIKN